MDDLLRDQTVLDGLRAGARVSARRASEAYRQAQPEAERWAAGYGAIQHSLETQARVFAMAERLRIEGTEPAEVFEALTAADRIANAAMWLVVHQTYAKNVYLDGRALAQEDFKREPEGHTGGALNMVPAYVGYMTANAISGITRSWLLGQGHTVAAVDSVNVLLDNMTAAHAERYSLTDDGLTRYVRDFYSYLLNERGEQDSPLGSHVNQHTAGALAEGGYLGFAELQYVHMPLPGERLVVFLSDGAFEEQRGSDWAPRWWRGADSGLVTPIMINNGRRIDQRSTLSQQGGTDWLTQHLALNGFAPYVFDGRDPAAFAWAIIEAERNLEAAGEAVAEGSARYPVPLPYGIAVAPKGAGFVNEGTNLAHNLPLLRNPRIDPAAVDDFNRSARRLHVPLIDLRAAAQTLRRHDVHGRHRERDHALAARRPQLPTIPALDRRPIPADRSPWWELARSSPMAALDRAFAAIVRANPLLRPRVGNPDEMRSNRLNETLEALRFRVTDPEPGIPETLDGAVITALNEEAVAAAAFSNKSGINLLHTYEAFGAKMHGVLRQEVIFTAAALRAGRPQEWLSVPLCLTSHTWENGKNEQSHQDPSMAEAMMGEASHVSRVLFVPDANAATEVTERLYQTRGQYWTLVIPKQPVLDLFTPEEATAMVDTGALHMEWASHRPEAARLALIAVGAYQLEVILKASRRLTERDLPHRVIALLEPGRFRVPRNDAEAAHCVPDSAIETLLPAAASARVFVTHTRPEPLLGTLRRLDTGPEQTAALGYINEGGTLDAEGLLYRNRSNWAHVLRAAARMLRMPEEELLSEEEIAALDGRRSPHEVLLPTPRRND